jgi:hypothetical protein
MSQPPTRAQLENGANGIAYRAWQLAGVASLLRRQAAFQVTEPRDATTISNALVESALVNARVLGWFFTRKSDVNISMFNPNWTDDVIAVAGRVESPVLRHLGHGSTGDKAGEKHPGQWPIPELSVVLIGGLARFVDALDANNVTYDRAWFMPSPQDTYDELMKLDPLAVRTVRSANPSVRDLTVALQQFADTH